MPGLAPASGSLPATQPVCTFLLFCALALCVDSNAGSTILLVQNRAWHPAIITQCGQLIRKARRWIAQEVVFLAKKNSPYHDGLAAPSKKSLRKGISNGKGRRIKGVLLLRFSGWRGRRPVEVEYRQTRQAILVDNGFGFRGGGRAGSTHFSICVFVKVALAECDCE